MVSREKVDWDSPVEVAARRCAFDLIYKIGSNKERILTICLLFGFDKNLILDEMHLSRNNLPNFILLKFEKWTRQFENPIEVIKKLKFPFKVIDHEGIYCRTIASTKNLEHLLDKECHPDWKDQMVDVEKMGLFLSQELSIPDFQRVLESILETNIQYRHSLYINWINGEEKNDGFKRFELLSLHFDSCVESPKRILKNIWHCLSKDGQDIFMRAEKLFKIEHLWTNETFEHLKYLWENNEETCQ